MLLLQKHTYTQFQFHNGTINTPHAAVTYFNLSSFQFHNGTINTVILFAMCYFFRRFNSTTVQLIPETSLRSRVRD